MESGLPSWKGPLRLMTVEPLMFLFCISAGIEGPAIGALVYEKTCIGMYNLTICDTILADSDPDNVTESMLSEITKSTSQFYFYQKIVYTIPCMFLATFLGSWSDVLGRRLVMAIPCFGFCLFSLCYLFSAYWIESSIGLCLLGSFFYGAFGGWVGLSMSLFTYVGNTSSEKYRTVRMMVLESFYYFGYCIAGLVSGLILEATNYVFVFTASTWLYATLIVYIYTWLDPVESLQTNCTALNTPIVKSGVNPNVGHHDSTNDATSSVASDKDSNSTSQTANTKFDDARRRGLLWFSPRHIKDTFYAVFKKRPNRQRMHILVLLLGFFAVVIGDVSSPNYLYFRHNGMSQVIWGYWSAYNTFFRGVGLMVVIPLLKKVGLMDASLLVLGTISKLGGQLVIAFAYALWMAFLAPVIGIICAAPFPGVRGALAHIVHKDEQGKINAVVGLLEELGNLLCGYLYNYFLFPRTLDTFGGACYLVGCFILFLGVLIFIWFYIDIKRQGIYANLDKVEETVNDDQGLLGDDDTEQQGADD